MTIPNQQGGATSAVAAAVLRLLGPLVRLLLRYGIAHGAFAELAKRAYISEAERMGIPGRRTTSSRLAVLTGLSRKEVARVREMKAIGDPAIDESYNRASRVLSAWGRDAAFRDVRGRPRSLPFEGGDASFSELVKRYSGDMPARAMLDELVRVGAVEMEPSGRIRLAARAYVPTAGEREKLAILGADVADLISTIDHNIRCDPGEAFFQRKVAYDNLVRDAGELRKVAADKAQRLLEDLDAVMAAADRDATPGARGSGRRRAVLGVYYYEETIEEDET
jgi:hypothetical protein